MWDDDEKDEGGDAHGDAEANLPSDPELAEERLLAFFDELDTVRFLASAADQVGDKFRFGAEVRMKDKDPDEFDCSELVEWSAHQAGVKMPDGSWNQFKHLNRAGTTTSIEEALETPGALLFRFGSDPLNTKGRPAGSHVAISLGDGRVVEATTGGVRIVERTEGWTHAGVIPGLEVAEDSPIWGDRPTGDTVGEDPPFADGDDPVPPGAADNSEPSREQPEEDPQPDPVGDGSAAPQAAGPDAEGPADDPGWEVVPHGGPPSEEQMEENRYLLEGIATGDSATNAIFDEGDLDRIGKALAEGRSVAMASNGHLYVGRRGEYEPVTEQNEEFLESRLGEMKQMVEAGVSIGIRPDGTFSGNRSDGQLKVFGGPDAALDQQEVTLITEYLKSGSRVQVHADGMIELRNVPGDPEPSFEEGQRLARGFLRLHDSGELSRAMAEGKMLTITHDSVEFTPSPVFAPGGDLDVPREPDESEEAPTGGEDSGTTGVPESTGGPAEEGGGQEPSEDAEGEEADEGPDQTLEEEFREDAAEARRFEVLLDRAADSHRSIRDEFRLEKLRLENRIEALDDEAREATEDLTRWDADIKAADAEVERISGQIAKLQRSSGSQDEVSKLEDLRTIANEERDELLDLRRPGETRLEETKAARAELVEESTGFEEQITAHTRMYEYMHSASESAETISKELLAEARAAVGKERGKREGESDSQAAARLQEQADRQESIAMLASRAADANEAHADRLESRITTLETRVRAEQAREQRLEAEVERMRDEVSESDELADRLDRRATESRETGQADEAEVYERRAVRARARSAEVKASIRLREQEDTHGGTTSDDAAALYQRQLVRLRQEHESLRVEVVDLRELSVSYESQAEGLEVMARIMDPTVEPRDKGEGEDPDVDVDVVSGEASIDLGQDLVGDDADVDSDSRDDLEPDDQHEDERESGFDDPSTSARREEIEDTEQSTIAELEDSLDGLVADIGTADIAHESDDPLVDTPDHGVEESLDDFASDSAVSDGASFEPETPDEPFDEPL